MLEKIASGITAPQGFKAAAAKAGIKKKDKYDVAVIYSTAPAAAAAVFTTNKLAAAPVIVSRENMASGYISAVVVNSGCANACTGDGGLADAKEMAKVTAAALKVKDSQVLIASTGVIGVSLPMAKITAGIQEAAQALLTANNDQGVEQAIMTTDTFPKSVAYEFTLDGKKTKIAGISKGSGMIRPDMATTLTFITTDANISPAMLQKSLSDATAVSFNMISVDGDSSTNDMVSVMASSLSGNAAITSPDTESYRVFSAALTAVCTDLAKLIVRDGEGATKFLEIKVTGAASFKEAKTAAMSIANSPLVKTAFFGEDPNWGRILCAAGYAGVALDPNAVSLTIGQLLIVQNGQKMSPVDTAALKKIMAAKDIALEINLGAGSSSATVWTCDLSYDYVKINGEYTT
ncbi:MAG: bifunctional glutamate N-acetyltransferase/amino-acid acetyltransferase ArgJ [Sporomusaceae bacterium]|jgi:glutamate N-acetyltransferase/amino-acid N-acetyltransferase|nr:bifunctional glutamate N-acetyltransferase/amino-acid acetyltransferase ArgJ [Sporomusaceae bacterium]